MGLLAEDRTGKEFEITQASLDNETPRSIYDKVTAAGFDVGDFSNFKEKTGKRFKLNQPTAPGDLGLALDTLNEKHGNLDAGTTGKEIGKRLLNVPVDTFKAPAAMATDLLGLVDGATAAADAKVMEAFPDVANVLYSDEQIADFKEGQRFRKENNVSAAAEAFAREFNDRWQPESKSAQDLKKTLESPFILLDKLAYMAGDKIIEAADDNVEAAGKGRVAAATAAYVGIQAIGLLSPIAWSRHARAVAEKRAMAEAARYEREVAAFEQRVREETASITSTLTEEQTATTVRRQAVNATRGQALIDDVNRLRRDIDDVEKTLPALEGEALLEAKDKVSLLDVLRLQSEKELTKQSRRLGIPETPEAVENYLKYGLPRETVDMVRVPSPSASLVVARVAEQLDTATEEVIRILSRGTPDRPTALPARRVSVDAHTAAQLAREGDVGAHGPGPRVAPGMTSEPVVAQLAEDGTVRVLSGRDNLARAAQHGDDIDVNFVDPNLSVQQVNDMLDVDDIIKLRNLITDAVSDGSIQGKQNFERAMNAMADMGSKLPEAQLTNFKARAAAFGHPGDEVGVMLAEMVTRTGSHAGKILNQFSQFEKELKNFLFRLCK